MKSLIVVSLFMSSFMLGCNNDENLNEVEEKVSDSLAIPGFELVWNDEFNVDGKPDETKWGYDIWDPGKVNNELQYYTSDSINVRVKNGKLELETHYYSSPKDQYTSARIVSREKGDWLYGRVEVKAKLPAGRGTWPAIWMLPTDWEYGGWPRSGEIDIMEHVGYDPNVVHGTVHTESFNHMINTQVGKHVNMKTAITAYHIYAIEWFEDRIDFYIDDYKYFTFENQNKTYKEWPFNKRFHLIMNIAVGGSWGGVQGVDNTIFPVQMDIDYVRVYKKSE